jgi:hypothetical protein
MLDGKNDKSTSTTFTTQIILGKASNRSPYIIKDKALKKDF